MVPLTEGPFFALSGKLSTDGAFGGVRVDPNMQAYRPDGSLMPGLFVTGDFASGRHIVMGGVKRQVLNDMSWALSSGFLAGSAAAECLP
jgi:fumarate reductase flavoprotein subunit